MKSNFSSFSKTTKIIIVVAVSLAVLALVVNIYQYRGKIQNTFANAVYIVKLPFKIIKLVSSSPDEILLMPVSGAEVKEVPDTWGDPRGEGRIHEGQDIFAARGTEVYSATEGYVVSVGERRLGGNAVFILGAGNRRYYYAHLDAFAPAMKFLAYVDTNTVIGYVGNTGNAETTPPHLHFGVYTQAGATNPLPLLRDRI